MPANSKRQLRLIYSKRNKYKTEKNTPKNWKWVWDKEWTDVNYKKLPEKVKEHIITKFNDFLNESKKLPKSLTIEKISELHGIEQKELEKWFKASLKFERKHTDNAEVARNIVLKNLEQNPKFYHEKFGEQEMNNIIKQIEREEKEEKNKN